MLRFLKTSCIISYFIDKIEKYCWILKQTKCTQVVLEVLLRWCILSICNICSKFQGNSLEDSIVSSSYWKPWSFRKRNFDHRKTFFNVREQWLLRSCTKKTQKKVSTRIHFSWNLIKDTVLCVWLCLCVVSHTEPIWRFYKMQHNFIRLVKELFFMGQNGDKCVPILQGLEDTFIEHLWISKLPNGNCFRADPNRSQIINDFWYRLMKVFLNIRKTSYKVPGYLILFQDLSWSMEINY